MLVVAHWISILGLIAFGTLFVATADLKYFLDEWPWLIVAYGSSWIVFLGVMFAVGRLHHDATL